ncbi:MAG: hypothetical protein AAGH64_11805 [Planctomycetota bacterium]
MRTVVAILALLTLALASPLARALEAVPARPAWRSAPVIEASALVPLVPVGGATDPLLASRTVWEPSALPAVRLPDGARPAARLRRLCAIGLVPPPTGEGATWFPPAVEWAEDDGTLAPTLASVWFLEVLVPPGAEWCEVGGRRVRFFDEPTPHTARSRAPDAEIFNRALAPVASDPTQRWRADWLGAPTNDTITDPLASRWARSVRARWDEAARRLSDADRAVLVRVEQRLVAIGAPFGALLPVWNTDRDDDETLLRELLAPDAQPPQVAGAGEAWLARTPGVVAWVVDDRPLMPEGRLPSCELGLLSLDALPATVELTTLSGPARLTPALPAGQTPEFVRLPVSEQVPANVAIVGRSGSEQRLGVVSAPLVAEPPALVTSDFAHAHTRDTLGGAGAPPVVADRRTRATLTRLGPGRWRMTVECLSPDPDGRVDLWLRDRQSGTPPMRRTPTTPDTGDGWSRVEPDRWVAAFDFSLENATDPDGLLRLAIVRTEDDGRTQSWPRPMTPGQNVPGRIAIDPSVWRAEAP